MTESRGRVLLVDDDGDIRELVALVLEARGYHVETAGDGAAALAWLCSHPAPDVVLMDLRMPRMAGDDVIRRLREEPALADLPVVIVSGDTNACDRADELEVQGCLLKPVRLRDLVSIVRRFTDDDAATPLQ